jgi:hypothetical protein
MALLDWMGLTWSNWHHLIKGSLLDQMRPTWSNGPHLIKCDSLDRMDLTWSNWHYLIECGSLDRIGITWSNVHYLIEWASLDRTGLTWSNVPYLIECALLDRIRRQESRSCLRTRRRIRRSKFRSVGKRRSKISDVNADRVDTFVIIWDVHTCTFTYENLLRTDGDFHIPRHSNISIVYTWLLFNVGMYIEQS